MGSTTDQKRELGDIAGDKPNYVPLFEGAPTYNGLNLNDKLAVFAVYKIKKCQGELQAPEDEGRNVEEVSRLYVAQKCAFEDVLTKEGFDITQEAPRDYDGRIAVLTQLGTVSIFGKWKPQGRLITMTRIHTPNMNYDHARGYLKEDLSIGKRAYVNVIGKTGYHSSPLRGLAINPRGVDGDELQASKRTLTNIGTNTCAYLMNQRRKAVKE